VQGSPDLRYLKALKRRAIRLRELPLKVCRMDWDTLMFYICSFPREQAFASGCDLNIE
jgi:hypothetical protein